MNKTLLYLIYFAVYSAILLMIGKSSLHDSNSASKFFIGGRKLGLGLCVATFTGTWVSAASILSLTGSVYESGYAALLFSVIPWFVGALLLLSISGKLYENDITSIPELFARRYGSTSLQVFYGGCFVLVYIFYLVIQIRGFGIVASALFDIPYSISIFLVYLFILYTTFGGYRSVTRSDAFNLILLIVSLGILLFAVMAQVGGFGKLLSGAGEISGYAHGGMSFATEKGDLLHLFGKGDFAPMMSLSMFFGWGLGLAANPQYAVRILGAKDKTTAKRMILWSLVILAFIYFALTSIGLGMRVLIPSLPQLTDTDSIITYLLNNELYTTWSGFFLFSIIGACISTANSQLLLIASSFAYDIVQPLRKKPLSESALLTLSRVSILVGGTLSLLLSMQPPSLLLRYGGDIWGVIGVLLFPAMYGTLAWKRTSKRGIWCSFICGGISILIFYPQYYLGALPVHPALPGVIVSALGLLWGSMAMPNVSQLSEDTDEA